MEADDRRFEQTAVAIHRISTAIEVSAATQEAQLKEQREVREQRDRIVNHWGLKFTIGSLIAAPIVAAVITKL